MSELRLPEACQHCDNHEALQLALLTQKLAEAQEKLLALEKKLAELEKNVCCPKDL